VDAVTDEEATAMMLALARGEGKYLSVDPLAELRRSIV